MIGFDGPCAPQELRAPFGVTLGSAPSPNQLDVEIVSGGDLDCDRETLQIIPVIERGQAVAAGVGG